MRYGALVVDACESLYPEGRYARMRNIGVIQTLPTSSMDD